MSYLPLRSKARVFAVHARDPHTVVAIFCRLTAFIGCALNRTCCCAAHRTASCRRIGPRTLRWLRRVVASLLLRRKARVFAVYGSMVEPSAASIHTVVAIFVE